MMFNKINFLLEIRTLEEQQDELTTSDLQGCVQAITNKYFEQYDYTIDNYILQYIYGKINIETLFKLIEQDVKID